MAIHIQKRSSLYMYQNHLTRESDAIAKSGKQNVVQFVVNKMILIRLFFFRGRDWATSMWHALSNALEIV